MYICTYVHMYICAYVHMYICIYVYIYTYTYINVCIICTHTHMCSTQCILIHTQPPTHSPSTRVHIRTSLHAHLHNTHTHSLTH